MGRRRSIQLNVRLRPQLAVAFDRAIGDLPWSKVFVVERLVEAFTKLDPVRRERLLMTGALDAPEFVDHCWRIVGPDVPPEHAAATFEVLTILATAAMRGSTAPLWSAIQGVPGAKYEVTNVFARMSKQLLPAPIQPHAYKVEVMHGLHLLADRALPPPEAVELLRAARTT